MRVGALNQRVSLSNAATTTPDSDGMFEPCQPAEVWAAIQPLPPGTSDGRTMQHQVTLRYHAQVGLDTRLLFGTRELFVRGIQNVDERNEELRLLCDEVL